MPERSINKKHVAMREAFLAIDAQAKENGPLWLLQMAACALIGIILLVLFAVIADTDQDRVIGAIGGVCVGGLLYGLLVVPQHFAQRRAEVVRESLHDLYVFLNTEHHRLARVDMRSRQLDALLQGYFEPKAALLAVAVLQENSANLSEGDSKLANLGMRGVFLALLEDADRATSLLVQDELQTLIESPDQLDLGPVIKRLRGASLKEKTERGAFQDV